MSGKFDYASVDTDVNEQLRFFGQDMTLTHRIADGYNVVTGTVLVTDTNEAAIGLVFDYGNKNIDGTLIKAGDRQLYLSPTGITTPEVDDTVTIGAGTYTITMVKSLNPAGTTLLYECNIRR